MNGSPVDRRRSPDRRRGVDRRIDERRVLADRRRMSLRRVVQESPRVHIRGAMNLLAKLEALAPTEETREEFRVANQRLWLAFQDLSSTRGVSRRGTWAAVIGLLVLAGAGVVAFFPRAAGGGPPERSSSAVGSFATRPPPADAGSRPPSTAGSPPSATQPQPSLTTGPDTTATGSQPSAPPLSLEQLGESLGTALQQYQDRFELFQRQQMGCDLLDSAFVAVSQRWLAYSVQRKGIAAPLGPTVVAADHSFYAAVDSVETRHERSGCPRP